MYEPKSCTYYKYDYDKKVYEQVPEVELEKLGVKNDVWEFLKDENSCKTVVDKVNKLNLYEKSSKTKASQVSFNLLVLVSILSVYTSSVCLKIILLN